MSITDQTPTQEQTTAPAPFELVHQVIAPGVLHKIRQRELVYSLALFDRSNMNEIIDIRLYVPRHTNSNTIHAIVWIASPHHAIACGSASGYGYHKGSAAIASAFREMGLKFPYEISACGFDVVRDAMVDIAARMGITDTFIHTVHS